METWMRKWRIYNRGRSLFGSSRAKHELMCSERRALAWNRTEFVLSTTWRALIGKRNAGSNHWAQYNWSGNMAAFLKSPERRHHTYPACDMRGHARHAGYVRWRRPSNMCCCSSNKWTFTKKMTSQWIRRRNYVVSLRSINHCQWDLLLQSIEVSGSNPWWTSSTKRTSGRSSETAGCMRKTDLFRSVSLTMSCQVRGAVPLRSDSIRLHIVRAIRADMDINHNSIIIFEQFSTPPCIRWSVRLYVAHLCNICHIFLY